MAEGADNGARARRKHLVTGSLWCAGALTAGLLSAWLAATGPKSFETVSAENAAQCDAYVQDMVDLILQSEGDVAIDADKLREDYNRYSYEQYRNFTLPLTRGGGVALSLATITMGMFGFRGVRRGLGKDSASASSSEPGNPEPGV